MIYPPVFPKDRENEKAELEVYNRLSKIQDKYDIFYSKMFVTDGDYKKSEFEIDFIIIDNGLGFGDFSDNIKDILNPYFTTKKKGTGLGLAIVNKTINDHNGKIDFIPIDGGAILHLGSAVGYGIKKVNERKRIVTYYR